MSLALLPQREQQPGSLSFPQPLLLVIPRMRATTIVATIDPWRLCRLPYPTFWFPIIEVWDFLDGDEYKAAVGNCRARLAKPGSIEFEIRTDSAMLDVASTSSFRKRRCVC